MPQPILPDNSVIDTATKGVTQGFAKMLDAAYGSSGTVVALGLVAIVLILLWLFSKMKRRH